MSGRGRYVLQTSPGLGEMELVAFTQVKYDKRDHTMKAPDPARPVGTSTTLAKRLRHSQLTCLTVCYWLYCWT